MQDRQLLLYYVHIMNKYFQAARTYVTTSPGREVVVGIAILVSFICLIIAVVMLIRGSGPKLDYQPAVACNLLTKDEAGEMLGPDVIASPPKDPTLAQDIATSKCAYTDMNTDASAMLVAALAVRSAVTDNGTERVKAEFAASKVGKDTEAVNGVGDDAYFNSVLGQLNILDGRNWMIVSYGTGESPQSNTLDRALELAQKIVKGPELPSF